MIEEGGYLSNVKSALPVSPLASMKSFTAAVRSFSLVVLTNNWYELKYIGSFERDGPGFLVCSCSDESSVSFSLRLGWMCPCSYLFMRDES